MSEITNGGVMSRKGGREGTRREAKEGMRRQPLKEGINRFTRCDFRYRHYFSYSLIHLCSPSKCQEMCQVRRRKVTQAAEALLR